MCDVYWNSEGPITVAAGGGRGLGAAVGDFVFQLSNRGFQLTPPAPATLSTRSGRRTIGQNYTWPCCLLPLRNTIQNM